MRVLKRLDFYLFLDIVVSLYNLRFVFFFLLLVKLSLKCFP